MAEYIDVLLACLQQYIEFDEDVLWLRRLKEWYTGILKAIIHFRIIVKKLQTDSERLSVYMQTEEYHRVGLYSWSRISALYKA